MSSVLLPDNVVASGDPGDETARRYRYQWTWAAITCCMLLDDSENVSEVFCEHHEDVLIKSNSGLFRGLQIKTRETGQPVWKSGDEAVKKSCARFCKLENQFPGYFSAFRFLTNHPLHVSGNGQDLRHVLREIHVANTTGAWSSIANRFVATVAREAECDVAVARIALGKTDADDGLPKLPDAETRLVSTLASGVWVRAAECTHSTVARAARHLADECSRASSLAHEDVLPAYLPAAVDPTATALAARLAGKRFNRTRLLEVLETGINEVAPLDGEPSSLVHPGSGNSDLLQKKLDAGGFSAISRNSAVDLRDKADYLGLVWTQKHGQELGLQRYSHIRSLVLSDAARAFEEVKTAAGPLGLPMLAELRSKFQQRRSQSNQLYECSNEHLEGFAYSLTSECKVQWSIDRPWEDE
jgi:hypothetical protein